MPSRQKALFGVLPSSVRGRRKGWGPEHRLQKSFADYFAYAVGGTAYWTGVDAANKDAKERIMRARRGIRPGVGDFQVLARGRGGPVFIMFDAKTETGRMSDNQKIIKREVEASGGYYYIVRNTFEIEQKLIEHGIPVRARHLGPGPLAPRPEVRMMKGLPAVPKPRKPAAKRRTNRD